MCCEKLAADIHRPTKQCEVNFDNNAQEVYHTKSQIKRYKPNLVISHNQKDRVEDLKNFTKAQFTENIEQYEMKETSQKEWKKGENGKKWNN